MSSITVVTGLLLTAVGVYGRFGTGTTSNTALIPAGLGLALVLLGALSRAARLRMHAMHAAVLVGLFGLFGCAVMAVPKLPSLVADGKVTRPDGSDATTAVVSQTVTGLLCAAFVALCAKSFVDARRARRSLTSEPPSGPPA